MQLGADWSGFGFLKGPSVNGVLRETEQNHDCILWHTTVFSPISKVLSDIQENVWNHKVYIAEKPEDQVLQRPRLVIYLWSGYWIKVMQARYRSITLRQCFMQKITASPSILLQSVRYEHSVRLMEDTEQSTSKITQVHRFMRYAYLRPRFPPESQ